MDFSQAYSEELPTFLRTLEKSKVDPDGMFFNDRLEKLFYPNGHPTRPKDVMDFIDRFPSKPDGCEVQ